MRTTEKPIRKGHTLCDPDSVTFRKRQNCRDGRKISGCLRRGRDGQAEVGGFVGQRNCSV